MLYIHKNLKLLNITQLDFFCGYIVMTENSSLDFNKVNALNKKLENVSCLTLIQISCPCVD